MQLSEHIHDDQLESYAREKDFDPALLTELDEHLSVCADCSDRLREIYEFVDFMRGAEVETAGHVSFRHDTEQGTVFLVVSGSDADHWEARFIGADINVLRNFPRGGHAKAHLEMLFRDTFPDHRCNPDCSRTWE